jgi:hypothetical protein
VAPSATGAAGTAPLPFDAPDEPAGDPTGA